MVKYRNFDRNRVRGCNYGSEGGSSRFEGVHQHYKMLLCEAVSDEFATNSHIDKCAKLMYNNLRVGCKLEVQLMAKYLTRQRKRLLEYLSEHTDEQMTARQIADALTADNISISAVYRNLSALELTI